MIIELAPVGLLNGFPRFADPYFHSSAAAKCGCSDEGLCVVDVVELVFFILAVAVLGFVVCFVFGDLVFLGKTGDEFGDGFFVERRSGGGFDVVRSRQI